MTRFDQIYDHIELNEAISSLLMTFVTKRFAPDDLTRNLEVNLRKAGWLASILAESKNERDQQKAQLFAILLHLIKPSNFEFDKLSYVILTRIGNLLSTKFLSTLYSSSNSDTNSFKYEFGELLNVEVAFDRQTKIISTGEREILTTSFQLDLWNKLSESNVAISAPTSAGKSFIIQNYLKVFFDAKIQAHAIYIVPTKALINQVSEDLRRLFRDTEIKTTFLENEIIENKDGVRLNFSNSHKKVIYVLTPERCLKLLQNANKNCFNPDIIFIDEIQNVEESGGRGSLFEFVLDNLSAQFPSAKFVTAGPFIKDESITFKELVGRNSQACSTKLPPVMQLKTIIKESSIPNNLDLIIRESSVGINFKLSIPAEFNLSTALKDKGRGFAKIVNLLSRPEQQSIVYCPKTNLAEIWALKLEELLEEQHISHEIQELTEYLAEEVHPKYYLIKCLKKRVAYHHSKLPDLIRKEIEDLYKKGDINILYCTTTLLQGVNLPANNLFITSPKKLDINLSAFEFGNLIGRAGRISDSLYGMIFSIESPEEVDGWAHQYYQSDAEKLITPTTREHLRNAHKIISNINRDANEIEEDGVAYAIVTLRLKYLKDPLLFNDYLKSKEVSDTNTTTIKTQLIESLKTIQLPYEVIGLNPTIDPLLQDRLYKLIIATGVDEWVITPNGNFYGKVDKENLAHYRMGELNFYWQLARLCEKLDSMFKFHDDLYFKQKVSISNRSIAYFGIRWLENKTVKEIIADEIKFYSEVRKSMDPENERDVNKLISSVFNIHTKVISYVLVKYFKLLADILGFILTESQKEQYRFSLSLPVMFELGTTEPIVIQLMSSGISRSVALKVFKEFKKIRNFRELNIFTWISKEENVKGIGIIYVRYLKKLNFIASPHLSNNA